MPSTYPQFTPLRMATAQRSLTILLGSLLLSAAGLKIHALIVDPLSQDGFITSSWVHLLMIEAELVIGLWLLSGIAKWVGWIIALVLFAGLTLISFYQGLTGQASCGCFGTVHVNPWFTFALDASAVALLLVFKPCESVLSTIHPITPLRLFTKSLIQIGGLVIVLLSSIVVLFLLTSKDPILVLAQIRGETLCVEPSIIDVGRAEAGSSLMVPVQLRNYGNTQIEVVGGDVSCVCMTMGDLPVTLQSRSSVTVHIKVVFKGTPGKFTHRFKYFHSGNEQSTVGRFTGVVLPTSNGMSLTRASK